MRIVTLALFAALAFSVPASAEPPAKVDTAASTQKRKEPKTKPGEKLVSGMSIVGNDEAPKALVIVPWKSSELGGALDLAYSTRVGPQPVDREVFKRALSYWEVRVGRSAAPEGRK